MRVELHVVHAMAVVIKVVDPFAGLVTDLAVLGQGLEDRIHVFRVELVMTEIGPLVESQQLELLLNISV